MPDKTFDRKYQREFRRLVQYCLRHKIACGLYVMRDLYGIFVGYSSNPNL